MSLTQSRLFPQTPASFRSLDGGDDLRDGQGRRFADVAREAFERHASIWKPRTMTVNRSYLRNQILPWFEDLPITGITNRHVRLWFAELHATPAAADRSLPVLSLIMREAENYGYRPGGTNPCVGIRRYRPRGRARCLTLDELARLGRALESGDLAGSSTVAVIRLLVLTGCRQGEMRALRWRDYRHGHLFLPDGKTGPRTVWLSSVARLVLDELPRTASWVFPARSGSGPVSSDTLYGCWRKVRAAADLGNVRLHDLRHSYASFTLRQGETVPTIGRLLGHRDPATTLIYAHFADTAVREAGEAIGHVLGATT